MIFFCTQHKIVDLDDAVGGARVERVKIAFFFSESTILYGCGFHFFGQLGWDFFQIVLLVVFEK